MFLTVAPEEKQFPSTCPCSNVNIWILRANPTLTTWSAATQETFPLTVRRSLSISSHLLF